MGGVSIYIPLCAFILGPYHLHRLVKQSDCVRLFSSVSFSECLQMVSQILSQATPADPDPDDAATSETFLGRIYRISAPTCDKVYVGSTRTTLAARLGRHRRDHRGYKRGTYHYVTSFEVLEHSDVTIDLLEEAEYHDMQQFRERESYWIQRLPS